MGKLEKFEIDTKPFEKAIVSILERCKPDALIVIETTVPPGTCEKIIKPLIKKEFARRGISTKELKLAHSYERVMPGPNYIDSIENNYRVFAGSDEKSAIAAENFLSSIINTNDYPITRLASTTASELSKVLENSYRAANIAFIQEWTELADLAGVNLYEVLAAIKMRPTHNNIMRPGLGVGGYCLTKDPLLASWAAHKLFGCMPLHQSEKAVSINDQMPLYTFSILDKFFNNKLTGRKVAIAGVSYLNDVGDTRNSPTALLYDTLVSVGANVELCDPYIPFWTEKNLPVRQDLADLTCDAVIVAVAHKEFLSSAFLETVNKMKPRLLLDTQGCLIGMQGNLDTSIQVKIIGKGN